MKIVVAGNGMVGYKFCEKLINRKPSSPFQIVVFAEEGRPAYDRVHLSEYFSGKTSADLTLANQSWYEQNNIRLFLGDPVREIDRQNKVIISHHGIVEPYDYLILATGSSAFVPPIPGVE